MNDDTKKNLEQLIETLSNITNNISLDYEKSAKEMSDKFNTCHRTLQQNMVRLLAMMIVNISEHNTDLRNEASIAWCKNVAKIDIFSPNV